MVQLPYDAPYAPQARLGTWLTARAELPDGAPPVTPASLLAAAAAVLARMAGEERLSCAVERPERTSAALITVGPDATVADLIESATRALAGPAGPDPRDLPVRVAFNTGAGPADVGGTELRIAADAPQGGLALVRVSGPAALFSQTRLRFVAEAVGRVLPVTGGADGTVHVAKLPLLSGEHLREVDRMNITDAPIPDRAVHERIGELCREFPGRVAVAGSGYSLTYGELLTRAQALSLRLRSAATGPEPPVYLCLPRGPELVVGWLAALGAGALCIPLDPDYPGERLRELTSADPQAPVIAASPAAAPFADPARIFRPDLAGPDECRTASTWPARTAPGAAAYAIHTSGSTGTPKAAVIEHRALTNLLDATAARFGLGHGRRVLAAASPGFDVSVWEILASLYAGATVVPFDEPHLTASSLASFARRMRIDTVFLLASLLARLEPADFPGVRTVITGGESFAQALVDRWQPGRDLIYVYGPTEATVFQAWHRCHAGAPARPPTIGRPMQNLRFHVLDAWGASAAPQTVGELYIGGVGPARGYRGRPQATSLAFGPDPFRPGGGRLYRTGDLASLRPDGQLDFRGRADHQLKIRGFRIEPGEVEARLSALPGVSAAAVVATSRGRPGGEPLLAAYAITAPGTDPAALRARLAERLPYYMVPAAVIAVPEFPRTPNGKIDRASLAARPLPGAATPAAGTAAPLIAAPGNAAPGNAAPGNAAHDPAAPSSGTGAPGDAPAEQIRAAMAARLGACDIGQDGDFFALGGDSLSAAGLAADLAAAFAVAVRVRDIFTAPTPGSLAQRIAELTAEATGDGRPDAVRPAGSPGGQAAPQQRAGCVRLSPAQRSLWLHAQLLPSGGSAYNVPFLLSCSAGADTGALRAAYWAVQQRHPILRARIGVERGEAAFVIDRPPGDLQVRADDGRDIGREVNEPFDLARGPLLRGTLFSGHSDGLRLLLVAHHLVCDGTSIGLIAAEIAREHDAIRGGRRPGRAGMSAAVPDECADVPTVAPYDAASADSAADLAYWRSRLRPAPAPLALPVDHPRTAAARSHTDVVTRELPAALLDRAREATGHARSSTFALLCAALAVVLHSQTGAEDICVGTAIDLRPQLHLGGTIGCHINTVALRLALAGDATFSQVLDCAVSEIVDAVDHALCPFDLVTDELAPSRTAHRHPFFDVWITVYPQTAAGEPGGLLLTGGPVPVRAGLFDLSFQFRTHPAGVTLILQYDSTLYEPVTVTAIAERLEAVLREAAGRPHTALHQLDLATADERMVQERPLFPGFRFERAEA